MEICFRTCQKQNINVVIFEDLFKMISEIRKYLKNLQNLSNLKFAKIFKLRNDFEIEACLIWSTMNKFIETKFMYVRPLLCVDLIVLIK